VDPVNQPGDASTVITALLGLAATTGDTFEGHLDPARIAAVGHSAGGYTTVGLLSGARDDRIRSAVVIAGGSMGGAFAGPPASVLFVHGDADDVVPYGYGRAAYNQVPWPKAFLTVVGGDHSDYLTATSPASIAVAVTVLDFLRATLYGDPEALARIPIGAAVDTITRFESSLVATPPPPSPVPSPSVSAGPNDSAAPSAASSGR
jgi:predicted dienelactone hydrolase